MVGKKIIGFIRKMVMGSRDVDMSVFERS
jgi:hypothetical protein